MTDETPTGWAEVDGALERSWRFPDFAAALAFADRVGAAAEAEGHHPELALGWGWARVRWTTHSAGSTVTARDRELAGRTDALAAATGAEPGARP